jgi:uncharacterized 2Fe-2S/4Fe-4S cluster protein (DUF4445 family)
MFNLKFILLFHKFLQFNLLAHTIDQSGDLDTFTNKVRDTFSSVEELNHASKVEVIWHESHRTLEISARDVRKITFFEVAIKVPLAVLCEEVGIHLVAILIDRLLVCIS